MTQLMNQSISDEAVYRTAPATPGLLKSVRGNKDRKHPDLPQLKEVCRTFHLHSRSLLEGCTLNRNILFKRNLSFSMVKTNFIIDNKLILVYDILLSNVLNFGDPN